MKTRLTKVIYDVQGQAPIGSGTIDVAALMKRRRNRYHEDPH